MKNLLCLALVLICFSAFSQNILIADNNAGAPSGAHVFSSLQDAINASTAGDIIHVIPSPTSYGTATIDANDSISVYGIGFRPDKDGPALSTVGTINVYGSNVKLSGLRITSSIQIGTTSRTVNNLAIENCNVNNIQATTTTSFTGSNILIRNCYINPTGYTTGNSEIYLSDRVSNSVITNCILGGYTGTSTAYGGDIRAYNGTVIKNNLFIGDGEALRPAFYALENCSVTNNIFFGRLPTAYSSLLNVTFNNNVAVGAIDPAGNALPPQTTNGVTGNNNYTDITDPATLFENPEIVVGDVWDMNWEPTLTPEMATELIGTDGTVIGPAGSTLPWNPSGVPLPLIQSVITSEVIKQGDDLNITIKARGN